MTDRKALLDQNETPEDVASLYSWANLHGAKYRDFSASRVQARERARLRMQQAIEEEREHARLQAESEKAALQLAAETAQAEEQAQKDRELAAEQAARQAAAQQAQAAQHAAEVARVAQKAAQDALAQQKAVREAEAAQQAAQQIRAAQQTAWQQQPYAPPLAVEQPSYSAPSTSDREYAVPVQQPSYAAPRAAEPKIPSRNVWPGYEARETVAAPAWLSAARAEQPSASAPPQAPDETLLGARNRLTSRWFTLKSVLQGAQAPAEPAPAQAVSHAPVLAVFSLAGGVGKTSLTATLGRALSARGERVLLVDTTPYGLLPFYFGAQDQRPGQLRTFTAPIASGDASVQMITLDPESMGQDKAGQEPLAAEIGKYTVGVNRVLVDLATASGATTRRVLRMSPLVLVPVTPDMNSVVSVHSIEAFFQRNAGNAGPQAMPFYVLNQFDASLPLHLDVREVLREQLGDRLLPITLRRAPAVSEALAEGMTVIDYAPNSTVAEDFANLAGWVKSQSAPASTGFRGVRWSER